MDAYDMPVHRSPAYFPFLELAPSRPFPANLTYFPLSRNMRFSPVPLSLEHYPRVNVNMRITWRNKLYKPGPPLKQRGCCETVNLNQLINRPTTLFLFGVLFLFVSPSPPRHFHLTRAK